MKAKKSLGQNFLKSEAALRKIIDAGEIRPDDTVLEIGPGKGALTERLLEKLSRPQSGSRQGSGGKVIAIEKDRELIAFLQNKFAEETGTKSLLLIQGDILEFEITNYELRSYKVIANIPYNITGAILKQFLTSRNQPERMVLMLQQEVAQRIIASPRRGGASGKESILSISVKAYGEPSMIMKVPARYFSPAPKVDSAIISIKNISRKNFQDSPLEEYPQGEVDESSTPSRPPAGRAGKRATPQEGKMEVRFWEIVKKGFAHKRKKLGGNLKGLVNPIGLASVVDKRAEDLTLADWIALAKML